MNNNTRTFLYRNNLKTVNTLNKIERDKSEIYPVYWKPDLTGRMKTFKHESLILAQDERWRRAYHMQVERIIYDRFLRIEVVYD